MTESGFFRILFVAVLGFTLMGWSLALYKWQVTPQTVASAAKMP